MKLFDLTTVVLPTEKIKIIEFDGTEIFFGNIREFFIGHKYVSHFDDNLLNLSCSKQDHYLQATVYHCKEE